MSFIHKLVIRIYNCRKELAAIFETDEMSLQFSKG
jgi:hypothetical protein